MDLNTAVSFANSAIKNLQLNEWQSRQLLGAIAVATNARGAFSLLNRETGFPEILLVEVLKKLNNLDGI